MTIARDYAGDKYGRLTLIKEVSPYIPPDKSYQSRKYLCRCDCGKEVEVVLSAMRSGNSQSCGCLSRENVIKRNVKNSKYGKWKDNIHFSRWKGMVERCYYPKHKDFKNYGAKGIQVCEEWKDHPKTFIEWIEKESNWQVNGKELTLDRIDRNGNYEPSNCKFSTHSEQAINRGVPASNTSGYPGVSPHLDRWRARITVDGRRKSLGVYKKKIDAMNARREAELRYYGKYLYDLKLEMKSTDASSQ